MVHISEFPYFLENLEKSRVHLEKSWNFAKNNKNPGKIIENLEEYFIEGKKGLATVIIILFRLQYYFYERQCGSGVQYVSVGIIHMKRCFLSGYILF